MQASSFFMKIEKVNGPTKLKNNRKTFLKNKSLFQKFYLRPPAYTFTAFFLHVQNHWNKHVSLCFSISNPYIQSNSMKVYAGGLKDALYSRAHCPLTCPHSQFHYCGQLAIVDTFCPALSAHISEVLLYLPPEVDFQMQTHLASMAMWSKKNWCSNFQKMVWL